MKYPIHFGLEKAGSPLILTTDNPQNLCFLIDTGSTENVIFDFVYKHFKEYFEETTEGLNIMGIDGSIKPSFNVKAELQFDDLRYKAPFAVLEANDAITQVQAETGIQIHGISETPFPRKNKCLINFNKLIIQNQ